MKTSESRDICVVNDRVFLLGLDGLYRRNVKRHERTSLLSHARELARVLDVRPSSMPAEGYYVEGPRLTEYFQLMRALQAVEGDRVEEVLHETSYQCLKAVTSSPIYGDPSDRDSLLPPGRDALSKALWAVPSQDWTIPRLTEEANAASIRDDEISLIGWRLTRGIV